MRIVLILALGAVLSGCSFLGFGEGDSVEPVEPGEADGADAMIEKNEKDEESPKKDAKKTAKAKTSRTDEQELKLARLWARVDELEEEQLRSKERVRVLEKGITLGLIPEELKKKGAAKPIVKEAMAEEMSPKEPPKAEKPPEVDPTKADPSMSKAEGDAYQAALASANDLYRSGRYGRAIVEYDRIGKDYNGKVDGGMHKYWIGKCWSNLKEFETSRQIFIDLMTENTTSPWLPRAKLELARVEWRLGQQDTALQRYREIIQAHPYEDAAEMAKMELENLGKSL